MFDEIRRRIGKARIPPHYNNGETTHHNIMRQHLEALEPRPVVVSITDTTAKTFRLRQMVNLDDALIWLALAYDMPDGQIHDLADLGRAWFDGKLFEVKP